MAGLVRAEPKDYFDIHTLLKAGVTLSRALGATQALYPDFNPVLTPKALTYYGEPALAAVPGEIRECLTAESAKVDSIETVAKLASSLTASGFVRPENPAVRDTRTPPLFFFRCRSVMGWIPSIEGHKVLPATDAQGGRHCGQRQAAPMP